MAWAALFAAAMLARKRSRAAATLAFLLVISHWLLDVASHRPDVPIGPHGPMLGLGLWNSVAGTVLVEGALFAAAVAYYARGHAVGKGFWALIATLAVIYAANVVGPPPPSVAAVAVSVLVLVPVLWVWGNRADLRPR
jgi:hypothetical protein